MHLPSMCILAPHMLARTHVQMHRCAHTRSRSHSCLCTRTSTRPGIHVCTHAQAHTHACIHMHVHVLSPTLMRAHACACAMHADKLTHTHAHIHTCNRCDIPCTRSHLVTISSYSTRRSPTTQTLIAMPRPSATTILPTASPLALTRRHSRCRAPCQQRQQHRSRRRASGQQHHSRHRASTQPSDRQCELRIRACAAVHAHMRM